jgi:3,4-dihydroxy 2-butanone 4-phosphate synthase/GTP cyclohydrolase II
LHTVFISDLVAYRLANESLIEKVSSKKIEFFNSEVQKYTFKDPDKIEHTAIVFGEICELSNVRVHNIIPDFELLLNQVKYKNLINSIEYLKENSGVLVFINKTDHQDNSTPKEFGIGAQIIKSFGISKMNLITSLKEPSFVGLSGFGLEVVKVLNI